MRAETLLTSSAHYSKALLKFMDSSACGPHILKQMFLLINRHFLERIEMNTLVVSVLPYSSPLCFIETLSYCFSSCKISRN